MTENSSLTAFLNRLLNGNLPNFQDTLAIIEQVYHFQPTAFENGLGENIVSNDADHNQGSCKVFSFARLHGLNEQQTLNLFGEHYRQVLATPEAADHVNIRSFMRHGWAGIKFHGQALTPKK